MTKTQIGQHKPIETQLLLGIQKHLKETIGLNSKFIPPSTDYGKSIRQMGGKIIINCNLNSPSLHIKKWKNLESASISIIQNEIECIGWVNKRNNQTDGYYVHRHELTDPKSLEITQFFDSIAKGKTKHLQFITIGVDLARDNQTGEPL